MRRVRIGFVFVIVLVGHIVAVAAFLPTTKLAFRVVDELGAPVQDAMIEVGCSGGRVGIKGLTDTNGVYWYEERITGELGCEVSKREHYQTWGIVWSGPSSAGIVPPVNVYTVVLKRIVHPVIMVHKMVTMRMPLTNEPVGFDFEQGDWVSPFGKGTRRDMFITGTKRWKSTDDMEITATLQFTNTLDGIQRFVSSAFVPLAVRSALPPPQDAPLTCYGSSHRIRIARVPGSFFESSLQEGLGHLIRVRTMTDENGVITAANHAWADGEISIGGYDNRPISVKFGYYYNPDPHSRSLEPEEIAKRQAGP